MTRGPFAAIASLVAGMASLGGRWPGRRQRPWSTDAERRHRRIKADAASRRVIMRRPSEAWLRGAGEQECARRRRQIARGVLRC